MAANEELTGNATRVKPQSEQLLAGLAAGGTRGRARTQIAAYPYRFPRDRREIGGEFTVEENARRLLRYFYFERRLAQALGSWTLAIPEFEVKLETGRHIFYHADAARTLRERLTEQEIRPADIDALPRRRRSTASSRRCCRRPTPPSCSSACTRSRARARDWRTGTTSTTPTRSPTRRRSASLKRILVDYEPMLAWAESAVAAYIDGGIEESRLARWRWHLQRVLGSIGGVTGADDARTTEPRPMRVDAKPYERGTVPMRDARFVDLQQHRRLRQGRRRRRASPPNTYETYRMLFIRTQRDEVDAIEAFGTFLWDIRFKDFHAEYDLARITWDEARHTEIGHRALAAAGYDPFELPNRLTRSTCRGPMEPEYAMAEINLFGEVGDPEDHQRARRRGAPRATTRWSPTSPTSSAPTSARTCARARRSSRR